MVQIRLDNHWIATSRHKTVWYEAGSKDGPLMIFVHGWPELGIVWRSQIKHFASAGWRCVAPNMRGYGGSSAPDSISAYSVSEIVSDMIELHDALGGEPAIWVGHDWGSPIVWAVGAHHAKRCRALVNLCVPYFARGFALPTLFPLVDRALYPEDEYPAGQWDYWLFYRENFQQAVSDFELNIENTLCRLFRPAPGRTHGDLATSATIRRRSGWYDKDYYPGPEDVLLSEDDFEIFVKAFKTYGFGGPCSWYMNDTPNLAYAASAPAFGRLSMPVLFIHAARDRTCDTIHSRLADPMRQDCADLTETTLDTGHSLTLERPKEVNRLISEWMHSRGWEPVLDKTADL